MIKSVIYDLDDTLYNFVKANEYAYGRLLDEAVRRFGVSREAFKKAFDDTYWSVRDAMPADILALIPDGAGVAAMHSRTLRLDKTLTALGLPILPHAVELYDFYWESLLDVMQPEPHVVETIAELKKRGYRIGIGTNMTSRIQYRKLIKLGLAPYVDFIVVSEESFVDKPDPRFFRKVLEKAGCRPEECLFVGDNHELDYLGARACGMHSLWYARLDKPWNPEGAEGDTIRDHQEIFDHLQA